MKKELKSLVFICLGVFSSSALAAPKNIQEFSQNIDSAANSLIKIMFVGALVAGFGIALFGLASLVKNRRTGEGVAGPVMQICLGLALVSAPVVMTMFSNTLWGEDSMANQERIAAISIGR